MYFVVAFAGAFILTCRQQRSPPPPSYSNHRLGMAHTAEEAAQGVVGVSGVGHGNLVRSRGDFFDALFCDFVVSFFLYLSLAFRGFGDNIYRLSRKSFR